MICVSIAESTLDDNIKAIQNEELAEIRLDLTDLSDNEIKILFSQPVRLIATCRKGKYKDEERKHKLMQAIKAGATYVDIEIETSVSFKKELINFARENNCKIIISYHNFELTPSRKELIKIIDSCFNAG
ncbi:MAG: type I 3-dehydroquinate dehydratase, partial [Bacteroidales bacterium]|nr:type I 3-dehydroquinate dehydratase [Bacteroidales bacterium]